MDIKADAVIIHRQVKVKARANEVKCNAIIGGEPCGATVFWVTLLRNSIKIQCITCYTEQHLRGPGLKKAIALLKASEKNKLLPVGKTQQKKLLGRAIDIIDAVGHHVENLFSKGAEDDINNENSTGRSDRNAQGVSKNKTT